MANSMLCVLMAFAPDANLGDERGLRKLMTNNLEDLRPVPIVKTDDAQPKTEGGNILCP